MADNKTVVFKGAVFDVIEGTDGRGRVRHGIKCPDWACVIPVLPDGRLVMVEQVRWGTREPSLEAPGGCVDEGENGAEGARRECEEETGYTAREVLPLGWVHPNPAHQDNRFHMYLAYIADVQGAQRLDDSERVNVRIMSQAQVRDAIDTGRMTHALHIVAIERALKALRTVRLPIVTCACPIESHVCWYDSELGVKDPRICTCCDKCSDACYQDT